MLRSVLLCLCLTLAACQAPNPYTAESLPERPGGALHAGAHSAATPGDYRTWRWAQPPSGGTRHDAEQLRDAVAAGLERLGLRHRPDGDADLLVRARAQRERRLEQVVEPHGGYGYGYRHPYHGWGAGPRVYSYHRDVLVMAIELLDGRTGQPVWQGRGESPDDAEPRDRLYRTARDALSGFVPQAAASPHRR